MRPLALLGLLAACGSDDAGTTGKFPDAAVRDGPLCTAQLSLTPNEPHAGDAVHAVVNVSSGIGFPNAFFTVHGPHAADVPTRQGGTLDVFFTASEPGPYQVVVIVDIGAGTCPPVIADLNIGLLDAQSGSFRVRLVSGTPQPDQTVSVLGGADFQLPAALVLVPGTRVPGQVSGPAGGLGAYLRFDGARPALAEATADPSGAFAVTLPSGRFDLLVVPFGSTVPPLRRSVLAADLDDLTLDAGDLVSGSLLDAGGQPIAGARVAVASSALPPVVVITQASGAWAAPVRGGPFRVTAIAASGIRIDGTATAGPVDARFPDLPLVALPHAPPGAVVTFVDAGDLPSGTVSGASAATAVRAEFLADSSGVLAGSLPRGRYHAVIGDPLGVIDVDLASPPATLAAPAAEVSHVVVRHGASAIAGARIFAVAAGAFGVGVGITVAATTDVNGAADLALSPGVAYDLRIDAPDDFALARGRVRILGGAAATVDLPAGIAVTGRVVSQTAAAQMGVDVEILCDVCGDDLPLAEAITAADGSFRVRVPDPGVAN